MDIQQITPHADGIAIPLSVLPTTLLCSSPLADSKVKLESLSNPAVVKKQSRRKGNQDTSTGWKDLFACQGRHDLQFCSNFVIMS